MTRYEIQNSEDPMSTLCRMAVQTGYTDLPEDVVRHAKHTLLDCMAVMIGGSGMDGIPAIVEMVKDKGGTPQSVLPFYGGRVPATEAALAIGRCLARWTAAIFTKKRATSVNTSLRACSRQPACGRTSPERSFSRRW